MCLLCIEFRIIVSNNRASASIIKSNYISLKESFCRKSNNVICSNYEWKLNREETLNIKLKREREERKLRGYKFMNNNLLRSLISFLSI